MFRQSKKFSNYIQQTTGAGGLPRLLISTPDGARAEIYLHGGHLTSWQPPGGEERLFLSETAKFNTQDAIRGGVPVIFPQFANEGPLPHHGFARHSEWELVDARAEGESITAILELNANDVTRQIWPHDFKAELSVTLEKRTLAINLGVTNTGRDAFDFTAALHTYLRIEDIHEVFIVGLGKADYLDTVGERVRRVQQEEDLYFKSEVDRIYYHAPDRLIVQDQDLELRVEKGGFPDVVVWNPWEELGASMDDLEPGGYRRMLCVEAAVIGEPSHLEPGQSWQGFQRLEV